MRVRVPSSDPWVFCSNDYAAGELSTLAQCEIWLFGDSKMGEAINAGRDLHSQLGARVVGVGYDEFRKRYKAKDPLCVDIRQAMKPVNFGLGGLMGPPKLVATARKDGVRFCELARVSTDCSKNPKITEYGKGKNIRKISPTCCECLNLAIKYRDLWYEEWGLQRYHDVTVRVAKDGEQGIPLESFGTGMLRLEKNPNAVSNHYFQNLLAQIAKHAGWLIAKEEYTDRKSVLFNNARTVVFVHDETVSEIREAVAHEAGWRIAELMGQAAKELCPDVKIGVEPALMRRWFKGADRKDDRNGKLVPWWPVDSECQKQWPSHRDGCSCWKHGPDQFLMNQDVARYAA